MRNVADWLEELGMPEYGDRFAENDIDLALLPELTDQDLEKIGVASLGHRRRILKAIAALERTPAGSAAEPASAAFAPLARHADSATTTIRSADPVGERRYLTVMFCDLVGSTAMSAQLDAEEWRDLVGSYLD